MTTTSQSDSQLMARALELAAHGQGSVEPNPMVGCVIIRDGEIIGEGWHQEFGGPHAEIEAIRAASKSLEGATMFVTLEPCCHAGKTPACTDTIISHKFARVVIAQRDPFPKVNGGGIKQLSDAGIDVEVGLLESEARTLNAPYRKLIQAGRPWLIAKWAMTIDGKLATSQGDSQWISNEPSRRIVHEIRGRVDGVMVGIGTARRDDPLLTARPPGHRCATRIIVDPRASLSSECQLARTARDATTLVAAGPTSTVEDRQRLTSAGCSVFLSEEQDEQDRLAELLDELGRRKMTNVLVEGGGKLFGSLFDMNAIDEVHAFIAPTIVGGKDAVSIGGEGVEAIAKGFAIDKPDVRHLDGNVYISGRIRREEN